MKQKFIFMISMLILSVTTYSQESFKKSLETTANDICSKMADKSKKKVVVLFVTDINKKQTNVGKYIADIVSFYVVNNQNGFSVFDRENLSGIVEAKRLIAEGYIDVDDTKQLGEILSVEAIVIGNYTVLAKSISLTLKALDVSSGFVIAQSLSDLPIDKDLASLLGIGPLDTSKNDLTNRGFNNTPLSSDENYNNPETVSNDCMTKNTGDYCFQNNSKFELTVKIINPGYDPDYTCKLKIGQTKCFYNLPVGNFAYKIYSGESDRSNSYSLSGSSKPSYYSSNGQINIEKCKSKTFIIK
jgi:hypothetical protein